MPHWRVTEDWKGRDVFIIGGGSSLKNFDWKLLENECTIGCNSAFILGEKVCKICIFGDAKWFRAYQNELQNYKGVVFTNASQLYNSRVPWLWTMPRKATGLSATALGWNKNTGASAVNLALILGAQRVCLLGFDMHLSREGRANWHDRRLSRQRKSDAVVYEKFLEGFTYVSIDLKKVFSGREIINITDDSDLDIFPKIGCKKFWDERKSQYLVMN